MMIVPESVGLRAMKPTEAALFADWEKHGRPYPWTEQQFLETLDSPVQQTLVLEEEGVVTGYGVLQVIDEESYLLNIMIWPERRRQGRGTELLRRLMEWAAACGVNRFFLDVDPNNTPAYRLYEKGGFQVTGRRPQGYPGGEESLLMRKDL